MLILLLAIVGAEPTEVSRDIDSLCTSEAVCVASQHKSLRYFLNLMVVSGVTQAEAKQCMREGKKGHLIDWTISERCIRERAKEREAIDPIFEERG